MAKIKSLLNRVWQIGIPALTTNVLGNIVTNLIFSITLAVLGWLAGGGLMFALGCLLASLLFICIYAVSYRLWLIEHQDWTNLRKARAAMISTPSTLAGVLHKWIANSEDVGESSTKLIQTIVTKAQSALSTFSPHILCCVKLIARDGKTLRMSCYYPPEESLNDEQRKIARGIQNVNVDVTQLESLLKGQEQFVFTTNLDTAVKEELPFHPAYFEKNQVSHEHIQAARLYRNALDQCGVHGVVLCRFSRVTSAGEEVPCGALKLYCLRADCVKDSKAVRTVLWYYANLLSLAIQTCSTLQIWREVGEKRGKEEAAQAMITGDHAGYTNHDLPASAIVPMQDENKSKKVEVQSNTPNGSQLTEK